MKKGFTLIELLAVIIVLAVIALIATPIVLDVIKDSKDNAAKSSAHGVLSSANYYYAEEYMKNNGSFREYECSFNNGEGCELLSISGDKPTSGSLSINKDGNVNGKIEFDNYVFYICNSKVLESESSECDFIEYEKIYAINEEGVITGFKTTDVASILDFMIPTVNASNLTPEAEAYIKDGKITIPEYVGKVEVTGIGCGAFTNYEIIEITILSEKVIEICDGALPTTLTKLRIKNLYTSGYSNYSDILETIPSNKKPYIITYNLNGGIGEIPNQEKFENIDLTITDLVPSKEGFMFLGWSTNKEATESEYESGSVIIKNENMTLYAVWKSSNIFAVGDTFQLDGVDWHVIEPSSADDVFVKALRSESVQKSIFGTSNDYSKSTVKTVVDNYGITLGLDLNNGESINLITAAELNALGCVTSNKTCTATEYKWLYGGWYWTRISINNNNGCVTNTGTIIATGVSDSNQVRPVIVINKSKIK